VHSDAPNNNILDMRIHSTVPNPHTHSMKRHDLPELGTRAGRRLFLAGAGAIAVTGCGTSTETEAADPTGEGGAAATGGQGQGGMGTGGEGAGQGQGAGGQGQGGSGLACTETSDNIEGPFYRADSPLQTDLTEPGMAGIRLTVSGRVLGVDCGPLAGALLDVWQANDDGRYDNDGVDDPPGGEMVLRGRMQTDADGQFSFRTIIPGRYLNGGQFRPSHLHVKVSAEAHQTLTTQLYFDGDPFNASDAWFLDTLSMALEDDGNDKAASYEFVLAPT